MDTPSSLHVDAISKERTELDMKSIVGRKMCIPLGMALDFGHGRDFGCSLFAGCESAVRGVLFLNESPLSGNTKRSE